MNTTYICATNYHILITLLKINFKSKVNLFVPNSSEFDVITTNLKKEKIFNRIVRLDFFIYNSKNRNTIRKETDRLLLELNDVENIYIYNDHIPISWILHKKKIPYHVIEDGYNFFSYEYKDFRDDIFSKRVKLSDYKNLIKHMFILRRTKGPGFSKYCQSIEVNDMSVVPKDERYHKFKEVPRKELFENISEERKQLILRVFGVEELSGVTDKSVLILTQPLSIDGLMNSDDKQYGFYKRICDKYLYKGYEVYLKPHPRDTITYEEMNGVNLIAQTVPMELIEMVSDVKFERIITHSSTAINFLTCGEEKEVFYDFNTREYNEKLLEKYNINKDDL